MALLIADLSGYTALTEAHGAFRASEIIDRFERIAEGCREPGVAIVERLVERDGKLFGAPLNLTARIDANARGGRILCTESVARRARTLAGVEAHPLGEKRFKNVSSPVALFDLVQSAAGTPAAIEPVCRMQVSPRRDHIKVERAGTTYAFCAHECAQVFKEAPERFVGTGGDEA